MPARAPYRAPVRNRVISALSKSRYKNLLSNLQPVSLSPCDILYEAGDSVRYVYFPNDAVISLVAAREGGSRSFEVCIVGAEGMLGIPALQRKSRALFTTVVRLPGSAMRVKASVFRDALGRDGQLQSSLFAYMQRLVTQVAQSAVCNNFHALDERLARWLLVMNDHTRPDGFPATHEFMAQMLGERRVSVTQAAKRLREAEVISYGRGRMQVVDRRGLEAASCNCYWIIKGGSTAAR